jgi:predicted TPR repeat methyltransferase
VTRRTGSVSRDYFETLYTEQADPWGFITSEYEQRKYAATLAAIGTGHRNALEVGCSIGVFTHRLADRCERLLAVDISQKALDEAGRRCADKSNVIFRRMQMPREQPAGQFDLIILSEVGYYWDLADLDRFLGWLRRALAPNGLFVLVHYTGETDYPLTGDAVHDHVLIATRDHLQRRLSAVDGSYRLDLLAGLDRS